MNAILRVGILVYFSINILLGQSWRMDTTWVSGEGENWDLMISQPDAYYPYYSNGKCIIGGHMPNTCGTFPYLFHFDTRHKPIVARPVPFKGFPEKLYKLSKTGAMFYRMDQFFEFPEKNRIIWHHDHYITVTDTNLNYIKSYFEEMKWKKKKNTYYADFNLHINSRHYIRLLLTTHKRKFQEKGDKIFVRYGAFMAPGLKSGEVSGIGRLNINDLLDSKDTKVRQMKTEVFKTCDSLHLRQLSNRYASHMDSNEILWASDDLSRNIVRYDLNTGQQRCYSLMDSRPAFLPQGEYDVLPQPHQIIQGKKFEQGGSDGWDYSPKIIHVERGKIGVLDNYNLYVDESKDILFRGYGLSTSDSILKMNLKPYYLSASEPIEDRRHRVAYRIYEFRRLSTMEIISTVAVGEKGYHFLYAEPDNFTLFKAMWDGDVRKFALVRVSLD
jgi:hypothetical protein